MGYGGGYGSQNYTQSSYQSYESYQQPPDYGQTAVSQLMLLIQK